MIYALILSGKVHEIIDTDGRIEDMFHPDMVIVDVSGITPQPEAGWSAKQVDGSWVIAPYVKSPEEVSEDNMLLLGSNHRLASSQKIDIAYRVGTLEDAVKFEMATPEEVEELQVRQNQLAEWGRYAVLLGRVSQQEGWALQVEWPPQPSIFTNQ